MTINDNISKCKLVFFEQGFSITVEKTLAHFTTPKGLFKKLSISEIVYFRNLMLG